MWGERPRARGSRTRPVITAQALALLLSHHCDAKYQWTNAPTHPPSHRGRTDKWRAAPRLPGPLDRRGGRMVGRCSGGRSRDGLPTAQRAEAGGEGRHEGDLRTEVKNTERRRAARSFCAQPLTEEPQVSPLPAEGLVVWGDMRGIGRMTASTRRGAARPARCGACLHGDRAGIVGAARYRCSCVMCWLWPRAGVLACPCPCDCMCVITTRCDYPTARDLGAASSVVRKASRSKAVRLLPHSETSPTRRDALSGLEANLARHLDSTIRRTFCLSPRRLVARRGHTHAHSDGVSRFPLTVRSRCVGWSVTRPR